MLRIIGVPIDSVGTSNPSAPHQGCERSPAVLRHVGLVEALDAVDAGDLDVRIATQERDTATGVLGWGDVVHATDLVRAAVIEALHASDLPVVIGGCCTVLPGALAGARDALGVVTLAYVDGHLDLFDGVASPTGQAADMPLAVVTGCGPEAWVDHVAAPLTPLEGIAILGARDRSEARDAGSVMPEELGLSSEFDPDTLRDLGMDRAGRDTERALTTLSEGFWLHLDVDVLRTQDMPATDYLQPGGLEFAELAELLAPLGRSQGLVGVSLGCYNPDKDADTFPAGAQLVSLLAGLLRD